MTTEDFLKDSYGYDPNLREPWEKMIALWKSWYSGYNNPNSRYTIWTGRSRVPKHKKSMQLAKKICEDWADILYNVNCAVKVGSSESNEKLQKLLSNNSWWLTVNQAIERAFSVGTIAMTVGVSDIETTAEGTLSIENSEPKIEVVDIEKIFPLTWNNGKCTECAFVSYRKVRGKTYAVISVHLKYGKTYVIKNHAFEVDNSRNILATDKEVEVELLRAFGEFDTKSEKPWFTFISPAIAENIFEKNEIPYSYPFGISVFANAIDALCVVDDCFDALDNEINLGRKRVYVKGSMCETVNGEPVFDATDISVYQLPEGMNSEDLIQSENSELRTNSIIGALDAALSAASNLSGLGKSRYKFDTERMITATQVVSSDSEIKRKMDKHRTRLENELFDLLEVLIGAANTFSHYNIDPSGLALVFDLSQFEDEETKSQRKLREKEAGIISASEYRVAVYGESEEVAKKRIDEANKEKAKEMQNFAVQEDLYV